MVLIALPQYVVIWCPRSIFSLVGIMVAFSGYWMMENKWDEQGPSKTENNTTNSSNNSNDNDNAEMGYQPTAENGASELPPTTYEESMNEFMEATLDAATPLPTVMLLGFLLWAVSFLFSPFGASFGLLLSYQNMTCCVTVLVIGLLVSKPLQVATKNRNLNLKFRLYAALIVCWGLLVLFSILESSIQASPLFSSIGVILVIASYYLLWKHRKMGETWDLEGKPNANFAVQSWGVPALVVGLYLFWVGSNAVSSNAWYDESMLPIYITERALVITIAINFVIVPMSLVRDYAFDHGSQPDGIGLDGSTFALSDEPALSREAIGAAVEGPVFHVLGWALLGISCFIPFNNGLQTQQLIAFFTCIAIAVIENGFVQPSFWEADAVAFAKMTHFWYAALAVLAVIIGLHGGIALALAICAVILLAIGSKYCLEDGKKGLAWLQGKAENSAPTVYGVGLPIRSLAMVLLGLAMSIPMN